MSFFTSSSGLTITGGNFTSISLPTQDAFATQVLGDIKDRDNCESNDHEVRKRHRCNNSKSEGLMVVNADEVDLHRELISGISYRMHSASHHGRFVVIKVYEGPCAKQDWKVDVTLFKEFLHPNVLKVVGVSDERSKSHFALFHGITSEQKMQSLVAKALQTDLNMSVRTSIRAVKGIAAGLSYIKSQNIPMYPGITNNNRKWESFNIFTGYDNEPIISFDPSSTVHGNGSVSQTYDDEIDVRGVDVLTALCQQLFSGANSILYDDSPERKFDREDLQRATLEDAQGRSNRSVSNAMSSSSSSTETPKSCSTPSPRREVWWLDLGAKNQSLESIKRRFEDCLDRFLLSSSNSLLPHITSPMDNKLRGDLHQCPGYLREEITLTSDVSKSVIVSHAFPSQSEVCSICGQLVQYTSTKPSIADGEEREASSSNGSHRPPPLQPSGFPSPQSPIAGPPSPLSEMSDSASIWTPPSPTFSAYSGRFPTTLQLRDNRPEEKSGLSSLGLLNPDTFTRRRRKSLDTDSDSDLSLWSRPFPTSLELRDNKPEEISGLSSLALLNPDSSTRHRRKSLDTDIDSNFPALSNRSVHFVPDTHRLRDNMPEEKHELSSQSLLNPDRFRHHRKLSDIDSASGWIPRSPTLSSHSGRSGPSYNNKPEETSLRFHRKSSSSSSNAAASSSNVIRSNDDYSHTRIPHNSSGGRRPLSGFFSSLTTMLSRKPSGLKRNQSRQRFGSIV